MISNNEQLLKAIEEGSKFEYLFFYGHHPKKVGVVDKSCLSQFYPAEFTSPNHGKFYWAEQYMMFTKARLCKDGRSMEKIQKAQSPGECKMLGKSVKNFDPLVWDSHKRAVVFAANLMKFDQNVELKEFLLSTGDKILVEAAAGDSIWGVGLAIEDLLIKDPKNWKGENLLGYALMNVRYAIKIT